jgi:hypothetical protein
LLCLPCSVSPFVHPHLSQIPGHVFQPSHFWDITSRVPENRIIGTFFNS